MADNQQINEKPKSPPLSRSKALGLLTFAIAVIGLMWVCYWFFYLQYHESTDDAYANGSFININSVISGAVVAYYADNTDLVTEGKLIVRLDPTNYEAIFNRELASLASVTLQVRQLYDNVEVNRANVKTKQTLLERAQSDYHDRLKLKTNNPEAVAKEDFIHAENDLLSAQFNLQQAKSQLESALSVAGNTLPENHPLIEQQKANIRTAYYNLEHCLIYAPRTGYVAQRTVEVGNWITPKTNLMAIIPTDYVWVDANFKETQLGKMRIGQPAVVWFDLYGSKVKYNGQVIGIASGTGSVFSLIPPQNATGNWIKIVQRLPVRVSLDPETVKKFPVRIGISAEVDVDVTNQDLPFLAPFPPEKPVATTSVFDIHMSKIDQIMDRIIQDNLKRAQQ